MPEPSIAFDRAAEASPWAEERRLGLLAAVPRERFEWRFARYRLA